MDRVGTSGAAVFEGVGVALVTLFDDDGGLDAAATADHASRLADAGATAVVVAGSTGEAASLDPEERSELVAAVRGAIPDGTALVAGTGAPSARQACRLTQAAADSGADAALVLSPPGSPDPRPYYEAVAAASTIPVLAYHFPRASAPGISLDHLVELDVAGCKDSSGDPERLLTTLDRWDRPLYVGSSMVLSLAGPAGATSAILALANVEIERCIAAFDGDATAQVGLVEAHLAAETAFPAGIKGLTAARYGTSTSARMG